MDDLPSLVTNEHIDNSFTESEIPNQSKKRNFMALYEKCKIDFSNYLVEHKNTLRLLIQNSTLKNIRAADYINEQRRKNENDLYGLTPLPYKSMRKIKSEQEKEELKKLERNAVVMRMIEYTQKMINNNIKQKYFHFTTQIIYIQKVTRGFLVRKALTDILKLNTQFEHFIFHIMLFSIKRRKHSDIVENVKPETEIYEKDPLLIDTIKSESMVNESKDNTEMYKNYKASREMNSDSNNIKPIMNDIDTNNLIESNSILATSQKGIFDISKVSIQEEKETKKPKYKGARKKTVRKPERTMTQKSSVTNPVNNKSKKNELNDSHGTNYHQRQPTPISTTFDVKKKTNPNTKKNIETTSTNVETNPKRISKPKTNTTNMSNTKTKDGLNSSKASQPKKKVNEKKKEASTSKANNKANSKQAKPIGISKGKRNQNYAMAPSNSQLQINSSVQKSSKMVQAAENEEDSMVKFTNQDMSMPVFETDNNNNNIKTENSFTSRASYQGLKSFPRIKPFQDKNLEGNLEKRVVNLLSTNKISKGEEVSINTNILQQDEEKEVNLSQFTENKSLLVDKFTAFSNTRQRIKSNTDTVLTKTIVNNDEEVLRKILLIQTKFRDYLMRQCDKNSSIRDRKAFSIRLHGKHLLNKVRNRKNQIDKLNMNTNTFCIKQIKVNTSNSKIERIQRKVREFLGKKGFYGKAYNRLKIALVYLIKNKINFSVKFYSFNVIKREFYVPESDKSVDTVKDDFTLTEERLSKVVKVFNKVSTEICLPERIKQYEMSSNASLQDSEIIENDNEVYK